LTPIARVRRCCGYDNDDEPQPADLLLMSNSDASFFSGAANDHNVTRMRTLRKVRGSHLRRISETVLQGQPTFYKDIQSNRMRYKKSGIEKLVDMVERVGNKVPHKAVIILVFVGIFSSIAADAGYLVLIPLGAAAFLSLRRHPLAGMRRPSPASPRCFLSTA